MCGIAGVFSLGDGPVERDLVDRMIDALGHRGPDARGSHVAGPVGLGHARLSIIDIAGGAQPMTIADGELWITFNGEIFNFVELRADMERRGHQFTTRSDTEVLLRLYEEKGENCVHDLNGQWAFAIWDGRNGRLFLSRDRIGVRPLFYTHAGGRFLFASEVKALFATRAVPRELDLKGLDQLFTFWAPLAPRTVFKGISELAPGHSLSIDASGCRVHEYWRPTFNPLPDSANPERCAGELLDLLDDATRIRLRSDVPVGAYLSGGLDSSVITALAKRRLDACLRTFSVTFDEAEFDEGVFQNHVAESLGTDHSRLECSAGDIAASFPDVIAHTERPTLRTAPAPLFLLSKLVRESGYKVVITGEGADEMLGGYDIFKEAKIRAFWARQPASTRRPKLLKRLYPYLQNVQSQSDAYLQAFFRIDQGPSNCFFSHLPRWQMTASLKRLFSADVRRELASYNAYDDLKASLPADFERWDWFARAQYLESTVLLPGYILSSQGDRVSMAHAVEARFPFLDHRVMQFAASLPARLKMKVLDEKHILKRAAADLVPQIVRQRRKQPYRAPDAASFVTPDAARKRPEYIEALMSPERIAEDGIFDPDAVRQLMAKAHARPSLGVRDNMAVVGILSTQLVVNRFIRTPG